MLENTDDLIDKSSWLLLQSEKNRENKIFNLALNRAVYIITSVLHQNSSNSE